MSEIYVEYDPHDLDADVDIWNRNIPFFFRTPPIFTSPLAFIDTKDLEGKEKRTMVFECHIKTLELYLYKKEAVYKKTLGKQSSLEEIQEIKEAISEWKQILELEKQKP